MRETVKIIGLCSKYIDGQGWTTEVPVDKLEELGFTKLGEEGMVLPKSEYERLKRVEKEKDRLYEIKLDLENQIIEKGWTDYEGADEIEKRVSKETSEKWVAFIKSLFNTGEWITVAVNEKVHKAVDEFSKQFDVEIKE